MSPQDLERYIVRFNAMFNTPDVNIADELFAPNFKTQQPLGLNFDRAGFKAYLQGFYTPFPDLHQDVLDSILGTDKFVLRVMYTATHQGEFMGVPATGRQVVMHGVGIFRLENGQVVENWAQYDLLALYQTVSAPAS